MTRRATFQVAASGASGTWNAATHASTIGSVIGGIEFAALQHIVTDSS